MNQRITKRERALIKGALRRVFSRSELRQKVLDTADIVHTDLTRPRVKKWSKCPVCLNPIPKYLMAVDHILPLIPTDTTFEEMSIDTVIDRLWCEENNLQPICPDCHDAKTKKEREERKLHKKGKKSDVRRKNLKRASKTGRKRTSSRGFKSRTISSIKKARRRTS